MIFTTLLKHTGNAGSNIGLTKKWICISSYLDEITFIQPCSAKDAVCFMVFEYQMAQINLDLRQSIQIMSLD